MNYALLIYIINTLGNIHNVISFMCFFFFLINIGSIIIISFILFDKLKDINIYYGTLNKELMDNNNIIINNMKILRNKIIKYSIIFLIPSFFICSFFPSERTMYLMLGATTIQKSNIPTKVEQIIDKNLDSYLQYLQPKKEQ